MSETWVWNENPNFDIDQTFENISFISNNTSYTSINIHVYPLNKMYYDNTRVYDLEGYTWTNEAYRTITFEEPPTGDLLTLLQANAVKQSAGGTGLKNLSSYNQDLSVPRKKDLDALKTLPSVTTSDNGKFLRVVAGEWAVASVPDANGVSF